MDIKTVKKLVEVMYADGLNTIQLSNADGSIKIERGTGGVVFKKEIPAQKQPKPKKAKAIAEPVIKEVIKEVIVEKVVEVPVIKEVVKQPEPLFEKVAPVLQPEVDETIFEIRSPIGGVFHSSFVRVGDEVAIGDVLCIILEDDQTNEITSDVSGVVQAIYVGNGDAIEVDQVMFRILGE